MRRMVAHEAAVLLYSGLEKEYLQAKKRAAESLNVRFLPSNREVAEELDSLAEDLEGQSRRNRLIKMRRTALRLMEILSQHRPKLIGSVWRGTATRKSDIDIRVYSDNHRLVENVLRDSGYPILRTIRKSRQDTLKGKVNTFFHIYLKPSDDVEVEVVTRRSDHSGNMDVCEIYGDPMTGLSIEKLRKTLMEDPLRRFLPE